MSDEEYVATLLAILTNPAPTGIDPADPYGSADDGIDRYGGFGRDVQGSPVSGSSPARTATSWRCPSS